LSSQSLHSDSLPTPNYLFLSLCLLVQLINSLFSGVVSQFQNFKMKKSEKNLTKNKSNRFSDQKKNRVFAVCEPCVCVCVFCSMMMRLCVCLHRTHTHTHARLLESESVIHDSSACPGSSIICHSSPFPSNTQMPPPPLSTHIHTRTKQHYPPSSPPQSCQARCWSKRALRTRSASGRCARVTILQLTTLYSLCELTSLRLWIVDQRFNTHNPVELLCGGPAQAAQGAPGAPFAASARPQAHGPHRRVQPKASQDL